MSEQERTVRITAKGRMAVVLMRALRGEGLPSDFPLVMKLMDAMSEEWPRLWEDLDT